MSLCFSALGLLHGGNINKNTRASDRGVSVLVSRGF
jgi:hypothetical protein